MRTTKQKQVIKSLIICMVVTISFFAATETSSGNIAMMQGMASWYAEFSPGIRQTTANMEIFDHDQLTCAIWDVPFNTRLEVTNMDNGRKVIVRVNDRGPAKRLCKEGRVIDLTMGAFKRIADLDKGLVNVRVKVL